MHIWLLVGEAVLLYAGGLVERLWAGPQCFQSLCYRSVGHWNSEAVCRYCGMQSCLHWWQSWRVPLLSCTYCVLVRKFVTVPVFVLTSSGNSCCCNSSRWAISPAHSTQMWPVATYVTHSIFCVSWANCELHTNGWTDQDAVCCVDFCGHKEPCIKCGQDPPWEWALPIGIFWNCADHRSDWLAPHVGISEWPAVQLQCDLFPNYFVSTVVIVLPSASFGLYEKACLFPGWIFYKATKRGFGFFVYLCYNMFAFLAC